MPDPQPPTDGEGTLWLEGATLLPCMAGAESIFLTSWLPQSGQPGMGSLIL